MRPVLKTAFSIYLKQGLENTLFMHLNYVIPQNFLQNPKRRMVMVLVVEQICKSIVHFVKKALNLQDV